MSYNDNNESGSGNVWSGGSRGGLREGYSRSDNDNNDSRRGESYRGSYGNNNSRRGGGSYGFRRSNDNDDGQVELLKDAIFIQNLPKDITREQIQDVFSSVGSIKIDDRSGGPKIWIYKDRNTGEPNGRATVTFDDNESADRAIQEYNNQHVDSIDATVRVQLAQRPNRSNDRGGHNSGRGYRGGRNYSDNNSRQSYNSDGNRWGSSASGGSGGGGFWDNRSGNEGFRGRGGGSDSYRSGGDRGDSYRGNRGGGGGGSGGGSYRGASHGNGGSSNYAPY